MLILNIEKIGKNDLNIQLLNDNNLISIMDCDSYMFLVSADSKSHILHLAKNGSYFGSLNLNKFDKVNILDVGYEE